MSNGETAIAYPNAGWNCRNADALAQMKAHEKDLPECPDDDDEKIDGADAVAYPKPGANCRQTDALA